MTRQRAFQKKWQDEGKCGYCSDHPPLFSKDRCKKCYRKNLKSQAKFRLKNGRIPLVRKNKKGTFARRLLWEKARAKHLKWVQKYDKLIAEHDRRNV